MTQLALTNVPSAIHPAWAESWAPDLTDPALRQALITSGRFNDRIAAALLSETDLSIDKRESDHATVRSINACGTPEHMRYTALMWLAPRLVLCLASPATRLACGPLERGELADIVRFRNHAPVEAIGMLPAEDKLHEEGWKCLVAWVLSQKNGVAARLTLQLAPGAEQEIDRIDARTALMDRVMAHRGSDFEED